MLVNKIIVGCLFAVSMFSATAKVFTAEPLPQNIQKHWIRYDEWNSNCPVPMNRLSFLTVSYYDFKGHPQTGNLVVFDGIAPYVLKAFQQLYAMHFPLEQISLGKHVNSYVETSSYNCRNIVGENNFSMHAYGLAVDINVMHNPYIGDYKLNKNGEMIGQLVPPTATAYSYLNRKIQRPGMNEKIVPIMAQAGLIRWGGNWQDRVDYQHFEVPRNIAINLIALDTKSAQQFMQLVIRCPECANKLSGDTKWNYLYQIYPGSYMKVLSEYFPELKSETENQVFAKVYQKLALASAAQH